MDRKLINPSNPSKNSQTAFARCFEFSGACSGCGETPYVQNSSRKLFGDRAVVAKRNGLLPPSMAANLPTTALGQE